MRPIGTRTHRSHRSLAPHLALALSIAALVACSDDVAVAPLTPAGPALGVNNGGNNRRMLFGEHGVIYSMNPDGSDVGQITYPDQQSSNPAVDRSPAWSPDGKQVAFVRQDALVDGAGEIYIVNADGSGLKRLTYSPGNDLMPTWSKDGKRIAFVSTRGDESPSTVGSQAWDIYVMNSADGGNVIRVTSTPDADRDPSWSMDGKQIAFASSRDAGGTGTSDLYVVTLDGLQVTRLTFEGTWVGEPSWAPGGKQIAFAAGEVEARATDVYVINTDGTQLTRLTDGPFSPGGDQSPTWSPDGKMIAFISTRSSDNFEIYTMNANGTGVTRLTRSIPEKYDPAWNR